MRIPITEAGVIAVARRVAQVEGWLWVEPSTAIFRRGWLGRHGRWEVFSNRDRPGLKVRVVIDAASGVVLEKGVIEWDY